uniref:Granulin n=1 Tax=Macrostomum lignano TaxID=282301 RepID=A0A1I8HNN8_9PLAT
GTCIVKQDKEVNAVVCPDGQSQCPDGSTCCKLQSGQYGCCPLEKATCCRDGVHCCPNGYKCDVSAGTCSKGGIVHALTKTKTKTDAVVCPDGQSQCPDGSTCCKLQSGQYGCCPLEKATCCRDGVHCCPNGYKCDVSAGTCSKGGIVHALTKTKTKTDAVVCPDGQSQCPDGSTCCKLQSGQYGCCPLEKATCCRDGVHCCPNGYKCDVSAGTCSKGGIVHALTKTKTKTDAVVCPDGQSQCPDGSTCCKLQSGQYGCCPLEKATCCRDGVHCCPNGYKCDVSAGTCSKGGIVHALTKTKTKTDAVVCPDGQSQCPDGSTCCKLQSGQYGCCPLEKATCCRDGVHCCPNGYKCDVSAGTCSKGGIVHALTKTKTKTDAVVCPDGQSQCPDGSTCCKLQSGQYGCCPLEKATCCRDGVHCCPNGYKCDVSAGTCSKGGIVHALTKTKTKTDAVVCPDGQSQCPDGSTCCKLQSGQYGCCPLEKATCCRDGVHCCPNGYKCDVSAGTCSKGGIVHALTKTKTKTDAVVCPDGQSQCPDGSTCCKLQSGQYGCCPLEKATCCRDGVHCCPNGYKCDVSAGTCSKSGSIASRVKLSSCCTFFSGSVLCCKNGLVCDPKTYQCMAPVSEVDQVATTEPVHSADYPSQSVGSAHLSMFGAQRRLVACAAGLNCGSKSTCCITDSGSPKCCSHSDGVCCSGGSHCCPRGFACAANGKCAIGAGLSQP